MMLVHLMRFSVLAILAKGGRNVMFHSVFFPTIFLCEGYFICFYPVFMNLELSLKSPGLGIFSVMYFFLTHMFLRQPYPLCSKL